MSSSYSFSCFRKKIQFPLTGPPSVLGMLLQLALAGLGKLGVRQAVGLDVLLAVGGKLGLPLTLALLLLLEGFLLVLLVGLGVGVGCWFW